jgi:tetratricopeptide (TPR) repeat protein
LLLIGVGVATYYNSFAGAFLLDDDGRIVQNPQIRQFWPPWQVMAHSARPVLDLSIAINYALGGLNVWGYHAVNVANPSDRRPCSLRHCAQDAGERHAEAALRSRSALVSLCHRFDLDCSPAPDRVRDLHHPARRVPDGTVLPSHAVLRHSGLRGGEPTPWFIASIFACALGMGTKEVMVTAPIAMLLYDRVFICPSIKEIIRRRWGFYLGLAATWVVLGAVLVARRPEQGQAFVDGLTPLSYATAQFGIVLHYLRLSLWPHPLVFDYLWSLPATLAAVLPGAVVVAALMTATVLAFRRLPWAGFWGAWFFLVLAPTSSVFPIADLAFEHRMYLPLAAIVVLVVIGTYEALRYALDRISAPADALRWSVVALLLATVASLAFATMRRNEDYRSNLAMWSDTVAKRPDNSRAHFNLGVALMQRQRIDDAVTQYTETLRLRPDFAAAYLNLGIALMKQGRVEAAMSNFSEALRLVPDGELAATAHYELGVALSAQGQTEAAITHHAAAVHIKPSFAEAHNNLGAALGGQGRRTEALAHFEEAIRAKPDYPEAHHNLGVMLFMLGRVEEAIPRFEEALRLRPQYREARSALRGARDLLQERTVRPQ